MPGVLKAQKGYEKEDAEKNVALICSRIANEDERGTALVEALKTVAVPQRDQLLGLVGRVGGKKLVNFVAEIATSDDAARRLHVRPGLTGLWQVSGRSDLTYEEAVRLDLYYVDNWSMLQDLVILMRTVGAVVGSRGAY